jgi:Kef-type K+ transport system membrane component KefB
LDELEFSFFIIVALIFANLAELLGMHFILGAFIAGLFFGRRTIDSQVYDDVKGRVSGITTGFLAPIFFASIGLHLNLGAVTGIPLFLAILIVIAFLTKLIGASVPAAIMGLNRRDSLMVGVAMSGRGAVELIIADIALRAGLFSKPEPVPPVIDHMFSAIVLVAILTTLMVPVGLRLILAYYKPESD